MVYCGDSLPRVTVWHHEACPGMLDRDPEEQTFLSAPHINDLFFFLHVLGMPFNLRSLILNIAFTLMPELMNILTYNTMC